MELIVLCFIYLLVIIVFLGGDGFLRIGCLAFSISDGHLKHIALFDVFSVNVNMYMKPVDIEHTDVFAIGFAIGFVLMMVLDVVME